MALLLFTTLISQAVHAYWVMSVVQHIFINIYRQWALTSIFYFHFISEKYFFYKTTRIQISNAFYYVVCVGSIERQENFVSGQRELPSFLGIFFICFFNDIFPCGQSPPLKLSTKLNVSYTIVFLDIRRSSRVARRTQRRRGSQAMAQLRHGRGLVRTDGACRRQSSGKFTW